MNISNVQAIIEKEYRCKAIHEENGRVHETFHGQLVINVVVARFTLSGNKAGIKTCFAWQHANLDNQGEPVTVVVAGGDGINHPPESVRAAILSGKIPQEPLPPTIAK